MTLIEIVPYIALIVLIYVSLFFLIALILKNWSIIDIGWGPGFVLISISTLVISSNHNAIAYILLTMITIWALRLALHIGIRNIGKGEDFRYSNWRKKWVPYPELQGYFRVFILQGSIMLFVSLPLIFGISQSTSSMHFYYHIPGLLIFLIGLVLESVADYQLKAFKSKTENKGKMILTGLWGISRHPNYLGEIILWWGVGLFIVPLSNGYLFLVSPLCMHLIMRYISIPVLEEKWENREDWKKIKQQIPILFPFKK